MPVRPGPMRWSGVEVRALRVAGRFSVREFARYLGVSERMISKWEADGGRICPRPVNQAALDTALHQASAEVRSRFHAMLAEAAPINGSASTEVVEVTLVLTAAQVQHLRTVLGPRGHDGT